MKLFVHTLLFSLLAFGFTSCDKEDDSSMEASCDKEVTFKIDGTEICASGTFVITTSLGTFTTINLESDGGEKLVISVTGGAATTYALGAGNGVYTDASGTQYLSTTGSFIVSDNASTMDATFNFEASTSDGTSSVSVTAGIVTDLPKV